MPLRRRDLLASALLLPVAACDSASRRTSPTSTPPRSSPRPRSAAPSAPATGPGIVQRHAASPDRAAWERLDRQATLVAPHVAIYAATVSGRTMRIVHRSGPRGPRPLASLVKLYVLYAVADAIDAGDLTWRTRLTLRREDKALGSGSLIGRPDGSTVTTHEAARLMIHVSDNTATDLLVRVLGQRRIASAVRDAGHSAPSLLAPFPTIKQDLWLEWSPDPRAVRARSAYADASRRQRARLLAPADRVSASPPDLTTATPQWQRGLGYFASASDIAVVMTLLQRRSGRTGMAPLRDVLRTPEPGLTPPRDWAHTTFKGGTVAGVQTGAWYADTRSGDQVLVVLASSSSGIVSSSFRDLADSAAALLAKDG